MAHISRLTGQVRSLLQARRVAALVSMVPFAVEPRQPCLVIHVSELAAHTRNLQTTPRVSLLVMQSEVPGEPVHALPRVTFEGLAGVPQRDGPLWQACRAAYLERFPEAEPMTQLGDFKFVAIELKGARQVAGFGSARSIGEDDIRLALA